MATYQELMQGFKDQGISPDWTFQPRTPSQYGSAGEGNSDSYWDTYVDKIAPTLTFNDVNYSYNPDTQTFSSGGDETKDPNTGWGRTYYLTTPEGTREQRVRSKSDWEKLKPAVLALAAVTGAGLIGAGGLGGLLGGEAAAAGGAAGSAAGSAAGGLSAAELAALGELGINTGGISSIPGSMIASNGAVISSTGELLGTIPASYGATTAGVGGSSGLPSLSKLGSSAASKLLGGSGTKSGGAGGGLGGELGGLANLLSSVRGAAPITSPTAYNPSTATVNPYEDVAPAPSMQPQGLRSLAPSQGDYGQNEQPMFNTPRRQEEPDQQDYAYGGPVYMAQGGIAGLQSHEYAAGGRYLSGPGDGMSDNIRANIEGRQEARLADGEFVIPADVVSHIGNGSSNAGAKKLHAMMEQIRKARTGNPKQGKQIKPEKYLPA
jgi:hypothetical protein